jgi:hypothetical protein
MDGRFVLSDRHEASPFRSLNLAMVDVIHPRIMAAFRDAKIWAVMVVTRVHSLIRERRDEGSAATF